MADHAAVSLNPVDAGIHASLIDSNLGVAAYTFGAAITDYFLMEGIDTACGPLTYHTWQVTGAADFAGASAGPLPCGGPLTQITLVGTWSE